MRAKAEERGITLRVDSAGTGEWHVGEPPCDNSINVARMHGLDITGLRARQVSPRDKDVFDVIVGLDASNVADLRRMGFTNVYKLGSFGYRDEDVPDPYFFPGFDGFEKVYAMIESCCDLLLDELNA